MAWSSLDRLWNRRARIAGGVTVLTASLALIGATASHVDASPGSAADEQEIQKLTTCYALGTDAIGAGDVEKGKSIYAPCFTNNAVISFSLPGADPDDPPAVSAVGSDAWADLLAGIFAQNGYTATQHLMGSINVELKSGGNAEMTSYLQAIDVVNDGTLAIAHGTYEDTVVRHNGHWKISRRTLRLIDSRTLGTPTP